jgi:hypothetical protein
MLRELNGKRADTARARVDENVLSLSQIRSFDEDLPGG